MRMAAASERPSRRFTTTSTRIRSGGSTEAGAGSCGGGDVGTRSCVVSVHGVDGWPSDELLSSYCGSRSFLESVDKGYIGTNGQARARRRRAAMARRWRHARHDKHEQQSRVRGNAQKMHARSSRVRAVITSPNNDRKASSESHAGRGARRTPRQARPRARKASDFHTPRLSASRPGEWFMQRD